MRVELRPTPAPPGGRVPPPLTPSMSAASASVPVDAELPGRSPWQLALSWLLSTALHLGIIIVLAVVTVVKGPVWHPAPEPTVVSNGRQDEAELDDALPPPPDDDVAGATAKSLDEKLAPMVTNSAGGEPTENSSVLLASVPAIESLQPALAPPSGINVAVGGVKNGSRKQTGSQSKARAHRGSGSRLGQGLGEGLGGDAAGATEAFMARMDPAKRAEQVKRHGGTFESETRRRPRPVLVEQAPVSRRRVAF